MNEFILATLGGILIGLSASILLLSYGKILGISGILGNFLRFRFKKETWNFYFLFGIIFGGWMTSHIFSHNFYMTRYPHFLKLIIAGLLVGFGTQLGNGCTSGHGVCGISRFSKRSLVATLLFISAGVFSVLLMKNLGFSYD